MNRAMKLVGLGTGLVLVACGADAWAKDDAPAKPAAKNVIVLMSDGCANSTWTTVRWVKGAPLAMDGCLVGAVRTYNAESVITDSAPAATAFACGVKTSDKVIGLTPRRVTVPAPAATDPADVLRPAASVLEGARLQGKATGLVVTCNVQHASPAGFSAHTANRNDNEDIGEQQAYAGIDVVFGGGTKYLLPPGNGGVRADGENLMGVLKNQGVQLISTRTEMEQLKTGRAWGLFAPDAMAYDLDRAALHPSQPSLAEMTTKALELLNQNPKGFFLFVEGSEIDWAAHANDPAGLVSDALAFDAAVQKALEFARQDGNTLVMVFADHATGGISIGGTATNGSYPTTSLDSLVQPLRRAKMSSEGVGELLAAGGKKDKETVRRVVQEQLGISDLATTEVTAIRNALQPQKTPQGPAMYQANMSAVLGPIFTKRTILSWTTHGHVGEDVFLFACGPGAPSGLVENTALARAAATAMGFRLEDATARLFQPLTPAGLRIETKLEVTGKDSPNPVITLTNGDHRAELPCSKNELRLDGKTETLEGVVIRVKETGRLYVPQQALDRLRATGF